MFYMKDIELDTDFLMITMFCRNTCEDQISSSTEEPAVFTSLITIYNTSQKNSSNALKIDFGILLFSTER